MSPGSWGHAAIYPGKAPSSRKRMWGSHSGAEVRGSIPGPGLPVWCLHVLSVPA